MIWLTWRQFRVQALATFGALAVLTIYLVILGLQSRHYYDTSIVGCQPTNCAGARNHLTHTYGAPFGLIGALLIGFPAIIGIFWGAPLIARELETGTHRLAWSQSVTRTHWLAVKLAVIGLASVAITGLLSLLLTWSASRFDQLNGNRFGALSFDSRNIVPLGYAVFALVLGTLIGLLIRRTIPAMALTLAIFAALQILMPLAIRAHLIPPVKTTVAFTAEALDRAHGFGIRGGGGATIEHYSDPGAWGLTATSNILNANGTKVTSQQLDSCMARGHGPESLIPCLAEQNLHFTYSAQPASRYWPFQWIELSAFLVLGFLLTGFSFWWIRNRPS
jgi:ABC-type transport system involved in multi-copper enzyme maturation permease subunit